MKTKIEKQESSPKAWQKVEGTASLYKYIPNGKFYFRGKINGRQLNRSLETANLVLAKRKLAEFWQGQKKILSGDGRQNVLALLDTYLKSRAGKNANTILSVIRHVKSNSVFSHMQIDKVTTAEITRFVTLLNLPPNGNNKLLNTINAAFQYAVFNNWIGENPASRLSERKSPFTLKVKNPRQPVFAPTPEQFEKIRQVIYENKFSDSRIDAWALITFCGYWGCYEAEARNLDWQDIDFKSGYIQLQRQKTEIYYKVPIYPYAAAWLKEYWEMCKKPDSGKVFKISTVKKSLETACRKIGFPKKFTIINLRQMFVVRLIRSNVSIKKIAAWVGHSDGGALILKRYSEVISDNDSDNDKNELDKLL